MCIVHKHKTLAAQCGVGWLVCCCFQVLKVILSEFEVNWHELPAQRRAFKVCWGNYVQTNQKGQNYRLVWQLAAVSKKGGLIAYSTMKKKTLAERIFSTDSCYKSLNMIKYVNLSYSADSKAEL